MIRVGFIGSSSKSSALVEKVLVSGKVHSSQIILSNRPENRPGTAEEGWDGITAASSNADVVKAAKYVFLCADPSETENVLEEIKDWVSEETNLISTSFPASIHRMESIVSCKITKLAPSMVLENGKCKSIICHNEKVNESEAEYIESLLCDTCNAKVYKPKRF